MDISMEKHLIEVRYSFLFRDCKRVNLISSQIFFFLLRYTSFNRNLSHSVHEGKISQNIFAQ